MSVPTAAGELRAADPVPAQRTARAEQPAGAPDQPYLVPVLSFRQELVLRLLALGWGVASCLFWLWWTSPLRGNWNAGRVGASVGLGWLTLLGMYFLFFACRMTRPNPLVPMPLLRVAIIVTKAPSEPWSVVERTLKAMLSQGFPYPYDVWLADEQPSSVTLRWCRGQGVKVSSRHGVAAYHQPEWPRRTKCKEGNLAYFYDLHGYDDYDVVAQLDADHVPEAGYLSEMVRPFADPRIGYVAAPSICDANEAAGWTVRGRLHREASLHGPVGAGSNGGWGPLCIGSHYAVRTAALREAGGLGPELAEDYSTSLWLQAAGWGGVFAPEAEAHGDGPENLNDMLTQELQWARSLGTILTKWAPSRLPRVPWRARTRMTFALIYYLFQGLICLAMTMLPTIGVLLNVTWGNATFLDFYLRLWLCSLFLMLAIAWLRRCGTLRPTTAKLWSYELVLFQVVRWPWVTWGFFQGMWAGRRQAATTFRVTPKGGSQAHPLNAGMLVPLLILALAPVVVIFSIDEPRTVLGLYILLVMQALLYLWVALVVVVLHVASNSILVPVPDRGGLHTASRFRKKLRLSRASGAYPVYGTAALVVVGVAMVAWHIATVAGPSVAFTGAP